MPTIPKNPLPAYTPNSKFLPPTNLSHMPTQAIVKPSLRNILAQQPTKPVALPETRVVLPK
jgi:hypothetical protein